MPSGVLEKFLGNNSFYFTLTSSACPQLNKKKSGIFIFFFTVGIGKSTVGASGGKNLSRLLNTERRLWLCTSLLTWVRFPCSCEHAQGDSGIMLCLSIKIFHNFPVTNTAIMFLASQLPLYHGRLLKSYLVFQVGQPYLHLCKCCFVI